MANQLSPLMHYWMRPPVTISFEITEAVSKFCAWPLLLPNEGDIDIISSYCQTLTSEDPAFLTISLHYSMYLR